MRKLFLLALALFTMTACQDPAGPTAPVRGPSLSVITDASEFLIRADAPDIAAAHEAILANMADEMAATDVTIASNTECVGVLTGTFDNVTVPPGVLCFLFNSIVRNNVHVMADALIAIDGTQVGNNVTADGADVVQIRFGSVIEGNVLVDNAGHPVFFTGYLDRVTVNGNVHFRRHDPSSVGVFFATIGKNLDVTENTDPVGFNLDVFRSSAGGWIEVSRNTGPGFKRVQQNSAGKRIRCVDNDLPFIGGPNASGNASGQCF